MTNEFIEADLIGWSHGLNGTHMAKQCQKEIINCKYIIRFWQFQNLTYMQLAHNEPILILAEKEYNNICLKLGLRNNE